MSRIESSRGNELSDLLDEAEVLLEGAEHAARPHWPVLLIEGIALILLGVLALFIPPLITFGIASSLGWVFLFGGKPRCWHTSGCIRRRDFAGDRS